MSGHSYQLINPETQRRDRRSLIIAALGVTAICGLIACTVLPERQASAAAYGSLPSDTIKLTQPQGSAGSEATTSDIEQKKSNSGTSLLQRLFPPRKPAPTPIPTTVRRIGVMALNLGGPETLDDVEGFLRNLFNDPDIIDLPAPLQLVRGPLAAFIASRRAPNSREAYKSIGGGSPLLRITKEQMDELRDALGKKGITVSTFIAMRYWHPFTEEAVDQMVQDGITDLIVLPLYPHYSISTTGSSLRELHKKISERPELENLRLSVIPAYHTQKDYVGAMADLIQGELGKSFGDKGSDPLLLFSAHGVPEFYVSKKGDPYKQHMEECVAEVVEELRKRGVNLEHQLSFQSRVGPVQWLQPYTDDVIKGLPERGVTQLIVVPVAFVSEHVETLEEIDQEYHELAVEYGVKQWGRVPALNANKRFIGALASLVATAATDLKSTPEGQWGTIIPAVMDAAVRKDFRGALFQQTGVYDAMSLKR